MLKLKWGEIPLGSMVFLPDGKPQMVIARSKKSISVLDMYDNKLVRHRHSSIASVSFKREDI